MLEISHVRKKFDKTIALNDINFTVDEGEIIGIIGQNGSGKTTLFRIILNLLSSDQGGTVLWNNKMIDHSNYNSIGYLPEQRGLYEEMTIREQIIFLGQLKGLSKKQIIPKITEWLSRFNVKGDESTPISSLSKGNQQKVQVIATLIHEPDLIIMDEPFSGLDPINASYLEEAILYFKSKGACILLSSHNMNNLEKLCDSVLMLHNGEQLVYDSIDVLKNSYSKTRLVIDAPNWSTTELLSLEGVLHVEKNKYYTMTLSDEKYSRSVLKSICEKDTPRYFSQQAPSLEELFKQKVADTNE